MDRLCVGSVATRVFSFMHFQKNEEIFLSVFSKDIRIINLEIFKIRSTFLHTII